MWCGPAPLRPYNPRIHPKGFRAFLDYANGTLGDWGIHWMDQILWWSEEQWPKTVFSTGARHIKADNTDAPDTQVVSYQLDSFTAVWEHRQYAANNAENTTSDAIYGTEGTLHLGWTDGWTFYPHAKDASRSTKPQLHPPTSRTFASCGPIFQVYPDGPTADL